MSTEVIKNQETLPDTPENAPQGKDSRTLLRIAGGLMIIYGIAIVFLIVFFTQFANYMDAVLRVFGVGKEASHIGFSIVLACLAIVCGVLGIVLSNKQDKARILMHIGFGLIILHIVDFVWSAGTIAATDFVYTESDFGLSVYAFLFAILGSLLPILYLIGVNRINQGSVARIVKRIWMEYSIIVVTVGLFIIAGLFVPRFIGFSNILIILRQASVIGVIAMGMTYVIITGGIDLSSGHIVAGAGAILIYLQGQPDMPLIVAILACLAVGTIVGTINGTIVTKFRVPAFIVTLAVGVAIRSIALNMVRGQALTGERVPEFTGIFTGNLWFLPNPLVIWLVLSIILGCVLKFTKFGSYIFAVGGNEIASRYSGISSDRTKIIAYALTGFCAALAAVIDLSRNAAISVTGAGMMYEFDAITAAVVGGASLAGGRGKMLNTFFGVIIIMTVTNMMIMFGITPYLAGLVRGLIILAAVLLQRREK